MAKTVSPAVLVLVLTLAISLVTGHPLGLFFARSIRGILLRFLILTLILVVPILILPKILNLAWDVTTNRGILGLQLVRTDADTGHELGKPAALVLRPVQGISLSLILAERFLSFLEFSVGASYTRLLVSTTLFFMGGAVTSIFLSVVWAFDDLGVRIYNSKTEEVHMAGSSIGTALPLITGIFGISGLFQTNLPIDALIDLLEIVMVLYPSYVFFAVLHHEFVARRSRVISEKLQLKRIQTTVR